MSDTGGTIVDYFCDWCQKPCQLTDRGQLCDEHYEFIPCEYCGGRATVTYPVVACAKCINEGRVW